MSVPEDRHEFVGPMSDFINSASFALSESFRLVAAASLLRCFVCWDGPDAEHPTTFDTAQCSKETDVPVHVGLLHDSLVPDHARPAHAGMDDGPAPSRTRPDMTDRAEVALGWRRGIVGPNVSFRTAEAVASACGSNVWVSARGEPSCRALDC